MLASKNLLLMLYFAGLRNEKMENTKTVNLVGITANEKVNTSLLD